MKNVIKTSLLAAAVAATFGASAAITVTTTDVKVGVEGTATNSFVNLGAYTAAVGANAAYTNLQSIKLTLANGTFNNSTSLNAVNAVTVGGVALVNNTDYIVSFNNDATEATLTLTTSAGAANARTALIAGTNIVVNANNIKVNGDVIADKSETTLAITTVSSIAGQTIDTKSAKVITGVQQLGSKVTKFAEKIDVGQGKMYWAGGTKDASTSMSVELNSAAVGANSVGLNGDMTVTLKGDFTFLDADSDGKVDTGTSIKMGATTLTPAKDFKSVTAKVTPTGFGSTAGGAATAASTTVTFTVNTDGKREIPVQSFAVDASYAWKGLSTVSGNFALTGADAGSWTLNGSNPRIPYMPFGAGISQIIYVTNNGPVDGAISYTAYDEAGTKYTGTLDVTAKANAVTQLSQALRNSLSEAGFTSGKLRIDLTINAPSGQLQVFAAYNVRGDRLAVGVF